VDAVLVEYLNSGRAWVLVGSGPSVELGYPSWAELAQRALSLSASEGDRAISDAARRAFEADDYPAVFEHVKAFVGTDRLLEVLREASKPPVRDGRLYQQLLRWPAAVYLTTNFDDEVHQRLARLGLAYELYGNSSEHMSLLTSDMSGAVVRLHGDLSSSAGLVLTSSQYRALASDQSYAYWRTRMTSIFQMQKVVVVGYSLRDPHIRAVLEAAKTGATATNPVCWIAPDVTRAEATEYLERYRIRVVPYPSTDDHSGLRRVVDTISTFVVPREGIRVRRSIANVLDQGRRGDSAATAVYVFNRLAPHVDLRRLRADVALAAFESALPTLQPPGPFSVADVLAGLGWPEDATDATLVNQVARKAVEKRYVRRVGDGLELTDDTSALRVHRAQYEHLRTRFLHSTELRVRRECPWLDQATGEQVARDIDASLTGFFKQGGLTLASVLVNGTRRGNGSVPASVIAFVSEASAQYETMPLRLAFWAGTLGAFTDAGDAEREYLGRLAQGFFAFHALGVFGDAAAEQVRNARNTVWVIDSSLQIPALAVASSSSGAYADSFRRLSAAGVRMFSTIKLFLETYGHLRFAHDLVSRFGADSHNALAAAVGDPPYWKQNLFLQGFIEWQRAGNPSDWGTYLHAAIGGREPELDHVQRKLASLGIEVVDFQDWPGFVKEDFAGRDEYLEQLKELMRRIRAPDPDAEESFERWLAEKIPPEAEAATVVLGERIGRYHILTEPDVPSPSWFVSATSVINALNRKAPITWQPEAFLAFVGTLVPSATAVSSDRAFEVILSSITESGLNPISEETIAATFGSVIDQATVELADQRDALITTLGGKYGEKPDEVLRRLPPSRRLIATIQMSNELVSTQREQLRAAQERGSQAARRADRAEQELSGIGRLRRRLADRQALAQRRRRQNAARSKNRKKPR
jgi:hypothetical protein